MCSCFDFAVEEAVLRSRNNNSIILSSTKILACCFDFMSLQKHFFSGKKVSLLLSGNVTEAKTLQELAKCWIAEVMLLLGEPVVSWVTGKGWEGWWWLLSYFCNKQMQWERIFWPLWMTSELFEFSGTVTNVSSYPLSLLRVYFMWCLRVSACFNRDVAICNLPFLNSGSLVYFNNSRDSRMGFFFPHSSGKFAVCETPQIKSRSWYLQSMFLSGHMLECDSVLYHQNLLVCCGHYTDSF